MNKRNDKTGTHIIREMREYLDLSQSALAIKANISGNYLATVELNYLKAPSMVKTHQILQAIAKEIIKQHLDIDYFIEDIASAVVKHSLVTTNIEEDYPFELDVLYAIYNRIQKQKGRK